MIHWTYAWTSRPCSSWQMQYALIRMVCIAPGTTRNESVAGLKRNDVPSPMCSGSPWPRRVCTTNAFGGTSTVFQRQNPVTRTSTADGTGPGAAATWTIQAADTSLLGNHAGRRRIRRRGRALRAQVLLQPLLLGHHLVQVLVAVRRTSCRLHSSIRVPILPAASSGRYRTQIGDRAASRQDNRRAKRHNDTPYQVPTK